MNKPTIQNSIDLRNAPPELIKWVEQQLAHGDYLPQDQVNTIARQNTLAALAQFKLDACLGFPTLIGQTTIDALAELEPKHPISEQKTPVAIFENLEAGERSGVSATLPGKGLVYANEWILPGCYLTWGEMTKDLDRNRLPQTKEIVGNIERFARAFAEVRLKYGKPIAITSGYRPAAENARIGGAPFSKHLDGIAADMRPSDMDGDRLLAVLKANRSFGGIGLGWRKGKFLHGDLRRERVIFQYG